MCILDSFDFTILNHVVLMKYHILCICEVLRKHHSLFSHMVPVEAFLLCYYT